MKNSYMMIRHRKIFKSKFMIIGKILRKLYPTTREKLVVQKCHYIKKINILNDVASK